jgi:hypothetical protein
VPKDALADTFREWDKLLTAAAEHAATVPGLKRWLTELQALRQRTVGLEDLRNRLQAEGQQATQDLRAARDEGKVVAIRIRSMLKGFFGHHHEGLIAFGVRPLRRKRPERLPPSLKPSASRQDTDPDEGQ